VKRRGVSEIIATIILIMIVSIAGTLLFAYSSTYIQNLNDQYQENNDLTIGTAQERFTITTVWWSGSDDFLNITVYNFGQNDIKITDIYIDGVQVSTYAFGRDTLILTEKILQLGVTSPVTITDGAEYRVTIVSERGVSEIVYWEA
jgi:flagellin-like protein